MRGKAITVEGFVGGVNTQAGPYQLESKEARDARNVVSTIRGAIRKRDGSVILATPAANLLGLFAAQSPTRLVGTSASVIYGIDAAGTITSLKTGLTNVPWEWVQAPTSGGQGPVFGVNGTNTPQQWDGAAGATADWTAASGTLPNGKYLVYAGNRVWVAGTAANPSSVYFSDLRDPRAWPVPNVVQFDPQDGEPITGLGVIGPYVLVFKPSKAWVIYDLDTGFNRPLGKNVGCVSHRSIVATPAGTFFLSKDQGVMVTDGQRTDRVSDKIKPTIDLLVPGNRGIACGAFHRNHLLLGISTSGLVNDLMLDYDVQQQSWWLHSIPVAQMCVWEPVAGDARLYGSKAGASLVTRLFAPGQTQDEVPSGGGAGVNYTSYYDLPWLTFKSPYRRKRIREIHFDGKGRIKVYVGKSFVPSLPQSADADFSGTDGTWQTNDGGLWGVNDGGLWGGSLEVGEARVLNPGVSRAWTVRFGNDTADSFEVESVTFTLSDRKD